MWSNDSKEFPDFLYMLAPFEGQNNINKYIDCRYNFKQWNKKKTFCFQSWCSIIFLYFDWDIFKYWIEITVKL